MSRAFTSRSKILLRHNSKEMARYDSCFWRSLPGFRRGMTVASFQESGTKPLAHILLKRTKRIVRLENSSLSSMLLGTKSAPIAVGFKFLRAFSSSVAVNGELSWLADGESILAATDGSTVVCARDVKKVQKHLRFRCCSHHHGSVGRLKVGSVDRGFAASLS